MGHRRAVGLLFSILVLILSNAGLSQSVAASGINEGTFTTNWYDPAYIIVNSVRTAVQVSYDSGQVQGNANCRDSRFWYTTSGWSESSHNLGCTATTDYGDAATYDVFHDPYFCATIDIWTYYNRNHAYATPYGESGWVDSTYSSGGCASWLWYNSYFEPGVYY